MGERERFEAVFRAEYPGLVRELRLLVQDPALAEEVAAEAFLAAWQSPEDVTVLDRPGAWIRKVALRQAGRARRRRCQRTRVEAAHRTLPHDEAPLDPDLHAALQSLSENQRVAVVLHHLGGWPAADIAEVLDCTEATVRSHLRRGRHRLAALLGEPTDAMGVTDGQR